MIGSPGAHSTRTFNDFYRRRGKRLLDVGLAGAALIGLSPVMAAAAVVVYLRLGAPVFFRQLRPGLLGREFELLKFRTMSDARDCGGELLPDAARLSPLGRFLRRTSVDELPQLLNVLKGDMALVGPRPLFTKYLRYYTRREHQRHLVRPGITGLAQISGRNRLPWDRRLDLDVQYVERQSFALDAGIMLKTVWSVLRRRDVDEAGTDEPDLCDERSPRDAATPGAMLIGA